MSYKNQIINFIKKKYSYTPEISDHSSFKRKDNTLIWTYPSSAGSMWRTFYSMDSNKNIIKEIKTEEKSVCFQDTWKEFRG